MKIAIDGRFWGAGHTGLGRYTENMVKALARLDSTNVYTIFVESPAVSEINSLPDNFKPVVIDAPHHSIQEQVQVAKAIRSGNFDLVHFPHYVVPLISFGTPFVVTIHDIIKHKFPGREATTLPMPLYWLKHFFYKRVMSHAVHKSQQIIVPTNAVKSDLEVWFKVEGKKVTVAYEGVYESEEVANDSVSLDWLPKSYLLYVGNAYPYKNVENLIAGLPYIDESISLVVVGSRDTFAARLQEHAEKLQVADRVLFSGYLEDHDLSYLYENALAYVSASREEGFGIPPIEAQQHSCPVILSDTAVHREVNADAAIYFHPDKPQEFASRVQELSDTPELRSSLIESGKRNVARFSWDTLAEKTMDVYKSTFS